MANQRYACVKCRGTEYKAGEIRTTGSGISRFFNIQNQKFAAVSCNGCGYTEMFRLEGRGIGNILDLLAG